MKKTIVLFGFIIVLSIVCAVPCFSAVPDKAIVLDTHGKVEIIPPDTALPTICKQGMLLKEGTRVTTGKGSYAVLAFNMAVNNVAKIRERSSVVLKFTTSERIELIDGELFLTLRGLGPGEEFKVRTPIVVCGARGTVGNLQGEPGIFKVGVAEGNFYLTQETPRGSETATVGPGFLGELKDGKVTIQELPGDTGKRYIEEAHNVQQYAVTQEPDGSMTVTPKAVEGEKKEEEKKAAPSGPGGPGDTGGPSGPSDAGMRPIDSDGDSLRAAQGPDEGFPPEMGPVDVLEGQTARTETAPGALQSPVSQTYGGSQQEERAADQAAATQADTTLKEETTPVP